MFVSVANKKMFDPECVGDVLLVSQSGKHESQLHFCS